MKSNTVPDNLLLFCIGEYTKENIEHLLNNLENELKILAYNHYVIFDV